MVKVKFVKSQSILEYLITLTAIVFVIIANTIGIKNGIQVNLDNSKPVVERFITNNQAPDEVKQNDYYVESKERNDPTWRATTDTYGGQQYELGYYFHEGETQIKYIKKDDQVIELKDNLIFDEDNSYIPKKPAGS